MNILYVCTANICRSPSAEYLMRDACAALGVTGVQIASAGVKAAPGMPGCDQAPALRGRGGGHRARPLTPAAVAWADLILTAARDHQSAVSEIDASVRPRTFTIRQAGRVAGWMLWAGIPAAGRLRAADPANWQQRFHADDPRVHVAPLDGDWAAWIVEELDASRGFAPMPAGDPNPDDVEDPHEVSPALHPIGYRQIWDATNALASLFQAVSTVP